jgi:hypothetical protein
MCSAMLQPSGRHDPLPFTRAPVYPHEGNRRSFIDGSDTRIILGTIKRRGLCPESFAFSGSVLLDR